MTELVLQMTENRKAFIDPAILISSTCRVNTVDSRYLDFCHLEQPLISKRKSDFCFDIEI